MKKGISYGINISLLNLIYTGGGREEGIDNILYPSISFQQPHSCLSYFPAIVEDQFGVDQCRLFVNECDISDQCLTYGFSFPV